ncbi:hypothetical protein AUR64_07885 [Haloprofundus marisrubri]|uniref:C4-dicarboxylate ABC transporter substrate-binding protein n=2 Tax=Haloprofundus marisrubri TaxID=1514971 RepID=A0A0W1RB41_9EURY|nr:hypothetical protein AUR64_07885 [Haloprofundus marisrubri]
MFITGFSLAGTQYEPVQVFDTPYMYRDYEHILEATDPEQSDVAKELIGNLVEETNIRAIGSVVQGTRRLTLSGEPAHHPDDLKGRKVRAVPIDMMFEAVNGIGANAVNIDWSEVPSALSTGSVDGQENPYNIIWNAGVYESQDYLIETNHMDSTLPIYISEHSWKKLSSDQQDIFRESMKAVQPKALDELESSLSDLKQKIGDEVEIIESKDIDMPAFQSSVRSHIREKFPDWIDTIEKIHGGDYQ